MKKIQSFALALATLLVSPLHAQTPADTGGSAARKAEIAEGGNEAKGFDMAPETRPEVVLAAVKDIPVKIPAGPFEPTWDSIKAHYKVPKWFQDAKFGIFMHWGLYSVPAYGTSAAEWYETHLYGGSALAFHTEKFGVLDVFGYKDFIPLFKAEKFDPDAWALLFKKSGAKYVIPTAQHHDNFSLWDSKANPINAKNMGPKRDLIGDLAVAVRKQGLKFGVSNHGIEAFQFVKPNAAIKADLQPKQLDLYDPKWMVFYNTDRSDDACKKFLTNWAQRNVELIDQYQPDMLWFDNGVDQRYLDGLKLWVAAYYYNQAAKWGKEVSISTKKAAYAPDGTNVKTIGSIIDFEKIGGRSPAGIRTGAWQVDEPIGSTWGYSTTEKFSSAGQIIPKLVDTVSKNGNLLLNLSPEADGTLNQEQQTALLDIGKWLDVNGEAIYGTHAWVRFSDASPGSRGGLNIRFTVKGDDLYAIILGNWPNGEAVITSLGANAAGLEGKVSKVSMLGVKEDLQFSQDASGLHVKLPAAAPCKYGYAVKISGLKMNADTYPESGNPGLP